MNTHRLVQLILRSAAISTFILGTITLLFPGFVVQVAEGHNGGSHHLVRFIGTALIGFGVANWFYSTFNNLKATLPAIYGNLASLTLAIVVDIIGLIIGSLTRSAWLVLGLHIFFWVAFIKCAVLIRYSKPR